MLEFDPSLITPFDQADLKYTLTIHNLTYNVDQSTYTLLTDIDADPLKFFVKPRNRQEKKYFIKKSIYQFDCWYVLKKSDLDTYYRSLR